MAAAAAAVAEADTSETRQHIPIAGITYNVLVGGPAKAPLVMLSHALMANLHMWDSLIPHLHAAGYRTLRYDHVGHGATSIPPPGQRYHFDDFTRHMREIVRIASGADGSGTGGDEGRVHAIIGCSMGGVLALRYSMLFPDLVDVVISCDAPGLDALEIAKPKWQARVEEFASQGSGELCPKTVERWFPPPCDEETKRAALEMVRTCKFEGYAACADAIQTYEYLGELSDKVKARTMVLVGENDEAVGPKEVLVDVAKRIRGAEYVCMKDTGHIPPMHQPEEFRRVVMGFLGQS